MALPLRTGSAAGAIIGFGIRNVPDRLAALQEIHRVLMPGGRLVVLEFGLPGRRLVRGPYLAYLRHVLPMMAAVLTQSPRRIATSATRSRPSRRPPSSVDCSLRPGSRR